MCKCSSWLGAFVSKLFKEQRCFSAKKMVALQAGTFIVLSRHMAACPLAQKCLLPTACHLASGPCLGNPGCIRHGPCIAHALQTHWSKIKIHTRQRRWWHCRLTLLVFFLRHMAACLLAQNCLLPGSCNKAICPHLCISQALQKNWSKAVKTD